MGLSEMMGMPAGMMPATQFSIPTVPQSLNKQLFDHMRAMRYMNAMGHMGGYGGRGGYGGYGRGMGAQDLSTGPNPLTMDPDKVNSILGQFGQSLPENPSPYAILPNSGFFGNHPRFGGALESALFGAANTGPSDTIGEGITSVARGIIGGQTERARAVNQQFEQPFQTASMLGQLMQQKQAMDLAASHEDRYRAQAQKDLRTPLPKFSSVHVDNNTGKLVGYDSGTGSLMPIPGQESMDFGRQSKVPTALIPYFQMAGKDPDSGNLTPADWKAANDAYVKDQGNLRGIGAGISAGAANNRQDKSEAFQADKDWTDKQVLPNSKEARQNYILGGGDPANWDNYRNQYNQNLLNGFNQRWGMNSGGGKPGKGRGGAAPNAQTASTPSADPVGDALTQLVNGYQAQQGVKNAPHFLPTTPSPGFQIPSVMNVPGTMTPTGSPLPGVQYNPFANR